MIIIAFHGKITISELSRIINISRPTLYKYVEEYERGEYFNIPSEIKDLFSFIYSDNAYGKYDILEYCVRRFNQTHGDSIIDEIKVLISTDPNFKSKLRKFVDDYYKTKYEQENN